MKKLIFTTILGLILLFLVNTPSHAVSLSQRLSGKILLQVQEHGEAWYIYPEDLQRYYLGRPADAFRIMRELGLGISERDYNSFYGYAPSRLSGGILLRVEANGEAYYVNPDDLKMHYLGRPADSFQIMRKLGLGITNTDLGNISIAPEEELPKEEELAPEEIIPEEIVLPQPPQEPEEIVLPQPSITISSPNGREVWQLQSGHTITWTPDSESKYVEAYLEKMENNDFITKGKIFPVGKGSIAWDGELDRAGNYPAPGGYYIRLVNTKTGATDRSDESFQLVAANDFVRADIRIKSAYGYSDGPVTVETRIIQVSWNSAVADTCRLVASSKDTRDVISFDNLATSVIDKEILLPGDKDAYYVNLICDSSLYGGNTGSDLVAVNIYSLSPLHSISVTYPTGGEILQKGATTYINLKFSPSVPLGGFVINLFHSYTDLYSVAHLKFCGIADDYSQDNATPPNVSWQWRIGYDVDGKEIPDGSYRIVVYDCGAKTDAVWRGSTASAKSNIFSIVSPGTKSITLSKPDGTETYQIGIGSVGYTWSSTYPLIRPVFYVLDSLDNVIYSMSHTAGINRTSGIGGFTLGGKILNAGKYRIKLCDPGVNVTNLCGFSAYFTVSSGAPTVKIVSPSGGETLQVGETYDIKWTSSGVTSDKLTLELSSATFYRKKIADVSTSAGVYSWTVTSDFYISPSKDNSVNVVCYNCYPILQDSSANFSIVEATICTDSDGGKDYYVKGISSDYGTPQPVEDGCINDNELLEYSCTGQATVNDIEGVTVLKKETYYCPYGCKDGACMKEKFITVTSPNGGEGWIRGSAYDITWESSGVDNVRIDINFYGENTIDTRTLVSSVPTSPGSWSWTIGSYPDLLTGDKVKIGILPLPIGDDAWDIYDESDNYFSITEP